jgi:nucleotide-binding universal stress UspA family protein
MGVESSVLERWKLAEAQAEATKRLIETVAPPGRTFSVHAKLVRHLQRAASLATRGADLVVVGQPGGRDDQDPLLNGALFGSGSPCLVMPRWISARPWGKRVLVAWKGTPQAARAALSALPFLAKADVVRVLVVDAAGESQGEDAETIRHMAVRWQRHGVRQVEEPVFVKSEIGDVAHAIQDEALGFGADLLVMGAFGHARAAEWVFGGVTRYMTRNAQMPLFMAH